LRSPAAASRPSSAIGRLVDNFGRNFNGLLDELTQYSSSQPSVPSSQPILSGQLQLAPNSPQANKAADLLDANNLMRAFLKTMSRDASKPLRPLPQLNDGTEAGRNRPLMDQLFESDILLTSRQMKAIVLAEAEQRNGHRRAKRKVITGAAYRWPKGVPIPYSFREPDKKWRQIIMSGLKLWEKETCMRFKENGVGKDRIEFIKGGG
ncbi:NAS-30 protein, partial [Aphelenchoides avenae]